MPFGCSKRYKSLLWKYCTKARQVWEWINHLATLVVADPNQPIVCGVGHALIGEPLTDLYATPLKWWNALRLIVVWFIWIESNAGTIPPTKSKPALVTKKRAWHQLWIVLRTEWENRQKSNDLRIWLRPGPNTFLNLILGLALKCITVGSQIDISRIPPEPD